MKLTATPFDSTTGALLPVYRDAYLRGDLSRQNIAAVDRYLKTNRHLADETLVRFHEMKQQGEQVQPVGWVQRQFELIRAEPKRFRQRASALVGGAILVAGVSMAAGNLPTETASPLTAPEAAVAEASMASMRTVTVRGRILDENGHPLIGATVIDKLSGRGVGTDAQGNYALKLPAGQASSLQFGYGGYADEEVQLRGSSTQNMTLVPTAQLDNTPPVKKHRRWLLF